jgi:hypothetical protein
MLHNGTLAAQLDEMPDTYIKQNICAKQQEYNMVHIVRRAVTIWKHQLTRDVLDYFETKFVKLGC